MRPFEILSVVVLLVSLLMRLKKSNQEFSWSSYVSGINGIVLFIHLVFEGYRWQMIPLYSLAGILFAVDMFKVFVRKPRDVEKVNIPLKILFGLFCFLTLVVGIGLPLLFPVFTLPKPSGPHAVGTTSLFFVDSHREEVYTENPEDKREILAKVWYPAVIAENAPLDSYWTKAKSYSLHLSRYLGLPDFMFDHVELIKSNSYLQQKASEKMSAYPVLIFSYGYGGGLLEQNTIQMEELASQGYVVFSLAHPYEGLLSVFPDGRSVPAKKSQVDRVQNGFTPELDSLILQLMNKPGPDEQTRILRSLFDMSQVFTQTVNIWAADTVSLMDELSSLNSTHEILKGKLDLDKIGLWGMSLGGATAVQVSSMDQRVKAALNLDGVQFGELLRGGKINSPIMMMYSANSFSKAGMNDFLSERGDAVFYRVVVNGSQHFNFTDFSLFSPAFRLIGFLGSIEPTVMVKIINRYTLAFFDKHLKGKEELLADLSDTPLEHTSLEIFKGEVR